MDHEQIREEFCTGHEVLVAPPVKKTNNLVLVTVLPDIDLDGFMDLIDKHEIPDEPVYAVRYGDNKEVRVVEWN